MRLPTGNRNGRSTRRRPAHSIHRAPRENPKGKNPMFPVTQRSRKRQLSINGSLGSGKTTVGRMIAARQDLEYFSTGLVQRQIAQGMGLSTLELNHIAETDRSIDERIDSIFKSLASKDGVFVDSRMAWHFLPDSFRVRLIVSPEEAADRVLRDTDRDAEKYATSLVAIRDIEARTISEMRRFQNTYRVDVTDLANYDFVIDSEFLTPDTVVELVSAAFSFWINMVSFPAALISPKTAIPSISIRQLNANVVADLVENFRREGVKLEQKARVLYYRGRHIIVENHEAFCAAVRAGVTAMPVDIISGLEPLRIAGPSLEQFVTACVRRSRLDEWENACGMTYGSYPSWISSN